MDLFETKNIKPMLLSEEHEPFDSEDYIYELKLDGIRSVVYLDESGTDIRNKENMRLNATYPEITNIHEQVKQRCILDGEIVLMKDGKPNFYELQKRSMMTNRTKIELAIKRLPVSFSAYDILYIEDKQITDKPLMDRKQALIDTVKENEQLSTARYVEGSGIALYNLTVEQNLEGIVAKKKDSKYYLDKRTKDWIKIKNLKDEDFIICGYIEKPNHVVSLVLGAYQNGKITDQGHVTLGVSGSAFDKIRHVERINTSTFDSSTEADVIWIKPILVCTVEYMMKSDSGSMRQPVFKGLRDDKIPEECQVGKT